MNPVEVILGSYPLLILDGALATELERRGCGLDDPLWSARLLLENPELIAEVHRDYLQAGADCLITASYQASHEGFIRRGSSEREAEELIAASVAIARRVRDAFWAETARSSRRPRPLVAASVGPFGAFLADGSEYRGEYVLDEVALADFHRRRLATLVAAGPDLLACETIPCLREARALVRLIGEFPGICCWVSFTARDGHHISNGERIRDCARWLHEQGQVAAVGINCTPPRFVDSLIDEIRRETDKPIVVYPNSGEEYDAGARVWRQSPVGGKPFGELARGWFARGARLIGGCCRTTPDDISDIAAWARKA